MFKCYKWQLNLAVSIQKTQSSFLSCLRWPMLSFLAISTGKGSPIGSPVTLTTRQYSSMLLVIVPERDIGRKCATLRNALWTSSAVTNGQRCHLAKGNALEAPRRRRKWRDNYRENCN